MKWEGRGGGSKEMRCNKLTLAKNKSINSSVVGCFRKLGVVGCVPYGTQGFLSSLGESSGLFLNKMDRVLSDVSLDTKMEVRYVQYD